MVFFYVFLGIDNREDLSLVRVQTPSYKNGRYGFLQNHVKNRKL